MKVEIRAHRASLVVVATVVAGCLAVTVAESILAPLFPSVTTELGLELEGVGAAFGLLTGSIAVGNLFGGWLLSRFGARLGLNASLILTACGAALAALSRSGATFLLAQAVIGAGTGIFFAPGINLIGRATPPRRRGLAMGVFGVAFSAGLAVAALLAALGAETGWRMPFWVAAGSCVVGALLVSVASLPRALATEMYESSSGHRFDRALMAPIAVASVGTVTQYGTVGFMALFAVATWELTPAGAALVVAAGRILAVPGKVFVGAASDRWGNRVTLSTLAICLGLTGLVWTVVPGVTIAIPAAVVFAAAVSGIFPIANVLALNDFGWRGGMLGIYRSTHIAVGAVGAWAIGAAAARIGLGTTLRVTAILPLILVLVAMRPALGRSR